ncbi:hypothetical protein BO71DRAFT_468042 [Aspergillus ellipticus CBS 707.79]|uniref:Uncharacterized protein n=1 Tax=Aspergillus ellipticus CBS 707.79 TaxID=1448320 RepID=A0A319DQ93_9EURO|nr:hypothetical protein BO71DRAFT_468042 [Aspergillus ellipticus CBS 707.79]
MSLEEGSGVGNTETDIAVYVRHELFEIAKFKNLELWPEENQIKALLKWSGKLFIAAATACRFIQESNFPDERLPQFLKAKRTTDDGTDPLDDIYRHLLELAAAGSDRDVFTQYFPLVVGGILVSKEPISVSDLEILFGLKPNKVRFVLESLGSVLIVPQTQTIPFIFFIFPFAIFSSTREDAKTRNFSSTKPEPTQEHMATACSIFPAA